MLSLMKPSGIWKKQRYRRKYFLRQARAASILESMRSITLNIVQENYRSYVKEGVIRRHLIA